MAGELEVHAIECEGPPTSAPAYVNQHWTNVTTGEMWLSNGTDSVANWIPMEGGSDIITDSVVASSSKDLDISALTGFCSVKYLVCLHNSTEDKWRSFTMQASKKSATEVEDSVYSITGQYLDVAFDFDIDGSNAKLVATNNETFDVNIRVHKIII